MKHTRVSIDAIAIQGAKDAHAAVGNLREALGEHLSAAVEAGGAVPPGSYRIGSISLHLPQGAGSASIGSAVAKAVADAVRNGRRLR